MLHIYLIYTKYKIFEIQFLKTFIFSRKNYTLLQNIVIFVYIKNVNVHSC